MYAVKQPSAAPATTSWAQWRFRHRCEEEIRASPEYQSGACFGRNSPPLVAAAKAAVARRAWFLPFLPSVSRGKAW